MHAIQVRFGTLDSDVPSFEEWKGTSEDANYDASSSEPIGISIPPLGAGFSNFQTNLHFMDKSIHHYFVGFLLENVARFTSKAEDKKHGLDKKTFDSDRFGNVMVKWSIQNEDAAKIRQVNVTWKIIKDDGISVQQESYEANMKACSIPVYSKK